MGKKSKKTSSAKAVNSKTNDPRPWRGMIIIGILAMLLYAPSQNYKWTLDDASAIEDNRITQLGLQGIGTHLTEHYRFGYWNAKGTLYRPLSLVMFSVEWALSPNNPKLHHRVNILMYGLLSALLFLLLFQMTKSEFWAILISILFVTHPVHVEVVANIKSRDEIMATLFGIAAMICWWHHLEGKSPIKIGIPNGKFGEMLSLAMGVLLYGLALFSKESTITLLAIFPAMAFLFFRSSFTKDIPKALLFLAPAILYLVIRSSVLGAVDAGSGNSSPLDNFLFATEDQLLRKASAFLILGKYLLSMMLPFELGSDYGFNQIPIAGFGDWRVLLSLALHGGLVYAMIKFWKSNPLISFGIFFYIATLSIFSNLIITIGSSFGERFLFLPSIGFLIFIIGGIKIWSDRKGRSIQKFSWNKTTQLPILLVAVFAIFFTYKTLTRMPAWMDSFTLYQTDIETAPNSAKLNFHYGLECSKKARDGKAAASKGQLNQVAKKHFEKAIEIYPDYVDAFSQLGLLYFRAGDSKKAMENYQKALQINPNKAMVYSNMGIIYFNSGQLDPAEEVYKKALSLDPTFVDAYQNLGAVYAIKKKFDLAIENFRKGLALEPNNKVLNRYMGSALRDSGNAAAAAPYLAKGQ